MTLSLGVVQPAAADEGRRRIEELAAWLRARDLLDVTPRVLPTYEELATSVRDGAIDVAWLPPVVYAWLAERVNPLGSILRNGATDYACALVTREDSSIRALSDLTAVRAGWVDPFSAAGYVVPRLELARRGILPNVAFRSEKFHRSHRATVLALVDDECDVAATYEGAWTSEPRAEGRVRVLAKFGPIPTDVVAVRRNLAPREHERVLESLRAATKDEGARPLLEAVFGGHELREDIAEGHVSLRLAYESGVAQGLFD